MCTLKSMNVCVYGNSSHASYLLYNICSTLVVALSRILRPDALMSECNLHYLFRETNICLFTAVNSSAILRLEAQKPAVKHVLDVSPDFCLTVKTQDRLFMREFPRRRDRNARDVTDQRDWQRYFVPGPRVLHANGTSPYIVVARVFVLGAHMISFVPVRCRSPVVDISATIRFIHFESARILIDTGRMNQRIPEVRSLPE